MEQSAPLSQEQFSQLVGGGECFIHRHPREPQAFIDRLQLAGAMPYRTITDSTYTPVRGDELLQIDTSGGAVTVTLPVLTTGAEFQITKIAGGFPVYVVPTAPETIIGSTIGISFQNDGTSVRLKNIPGTGYILL